MNEKPERIKLVRSHTMLHFSAGHGSATRPRQLAIHALADVHVRLLHADRHAHPRVEAALPQGVTVSVDWIFQFRESLRDGVYSLPGFLIIPAGKSDARFVGHRPGTEVRWQANQHLCFQADYGIFYAGKFVRESQPPQPQLLGIVDRLQVLGGVKAKTS